MTAIRRLILALVLILAGTAKGFAEGPVVVTSIFPLHALAAGVMQGVGAPRLLLDGQASPHDFALKPSQARLLQSADLVVWIGESLEYPLARYAANLPPERSFPLLPGPEGARNPHIWLDTRAAKEIVSNLVEKLRALDPAHADDYARNGAALANRIDGLEKELAEVLRPHRSVPYIVYHDAYAPFERRFGLENAGAVTAHPEQPPSAGQIRRMREIIAAREIRCAFREPQFEPRALAAIAEGNDIRIGELDPLGHGLEQGVNGYFLLMQRLGDSIAACLAHP